MDKEGNNLFHFNPRKEANTIVNNTKMGGGWGKEQRHNHFLFHEDNPFIVSFVVM